MQERGHPGGLSHPPIIWGRLRQNTFPQFPLLNHDFSAASSSLSRFDGSDSACRLFLTFKIGRAALRDY